MGTRKRTTTRTTLTPSERAVYDLAAAGHLRPEHTHVYRREIRALAAAGLIGREEGRFTTSRPPPPIARVRVTLNLDASTVAILDAAAATWGVSRAQAAARIIDAARLGGKRRSDPPGASGERLALHLLDTIVAL